MKITLFTGLLAAVCTLYGSFEVKEGTLTVKSKDLMIETRDGMIQTLRTADGENFCKETTEAFPDAPFRRSLFPEGPEGKLIKTVIRRGYRIEDQSWKQS